MKKKVLFSILFLIIFSFCAHAETLVTREYIPCDEISFLEISLYNENLKIQKYTGEDLLIEIYSNNSNIIPTFNTKNGIFNVQSLKKNFAEPIYCTVEIYVPVNFNPESIEIENLYGSSTLSLLKTKGDFYFSTASGSVSFDSIACNFFKCTTISSDINYENLNCEGFYISTISGNISLSLKNNTYVLSSAISQKGNITVSYNSKADISLLIYSEKSLIRNNKSYNTNLLFNPEPDNSIQNTNTIVIDSKHGEVEIIAK